MEVRIMNHLVEPGDVDAQSMATWRDAHEVPVKDDFITLGAGLNRKTWIVRYRVWRPGGDRCDVFCGQWMFNM